MELAALAAEVEAAVASLALQETAGFVALRRQVRRFLHQSPKAQRIEELVVKLLG
jgi:hypothetical protein